jgi:hypothetical protein
MPDGNVEKKKRASPVKRALFWSAIAFVIGFSAYHSQPGARMVEEVLLLTKVVVGTYVRSYNFHCGLALAPSA